MSKLDDIKARLEAQAEAVDSAKADQEAIDLEALFDARAEHGVDAVKAVRMPFSPGLPLHVIVRRPKKVEFKRYQDTVTGKEAGAAEAVKGAEQLAAVCRVYPTAEVYEQMVEACPGLKVAAGVAATGLASAKARDDAKP